MRITAAAQLLGISPRMLRYREFLGLLPSVRTQGRRWPATARTAAGASQADKAWQARAAPAPDGPRPPGRVPAAGPAGPASAAGHRQFGSADLDAVALGLAIEQRYDISPAALAFGVRVLADPRIHADVAELGRRIGRIQPPPARALDFEKERAQRLLGLAGPVQRTAAPARPAPAAARSHR